MAATADESGVARFAITSCGARFCRMQQHRSNTQQQLAVTAAVSAMMITYRSGSDHSDGGHKRDWLVVLPSLTELAPSSTTVIGNRLTDGGEGEAVTTCGGRGGSGGAFGGRGGEGGG